MDNLQPCSVCGEPLPLGPPITQGSIGSRTCPYLSEDWHREAAGDWSKQNPTLYLQRRRKQLGYSVAEPLGAIRNTIQFRFDILDPEFLEALAKIADYGAKKYGDFNWHKSRLTGDNSPVNHIARHLLLYEQSVPYDHKEVIDSDHRKMHLAAIAFNAMMEFWYESHEIK